MIPTQKKESHPRSAKLVLVVDDEPACRLALEDRLRSAGHEVHSAGTREEALALVRRHAYDVVVLDNNLSGINISHDGLDVLCAIRGQRLATKVLVITGYGSAMLALAARELGAVSYLEKPVPLSAMLEALEGLGVSCAAKAGDRDDDSA